MNKELWQRLINEITEISPQTVIIPFWRGEALLHPDFRELMNYALDKPFRIHISTNGHRITKDHIPVLVRCEFVTFSVHTLDGYSNTQKFLALRKKGKPIVQISFIKGEETTEKFLCSLLATPSLGGFDSVRLYEEHSIDGIFGKTGYSTEVPRSYCPKLLDTLVVAFDGTVSRCNHIWETEDEINLNKMSIREAWASNQLQRIRKNYPDALCSPCDQWTGHTCGESWRMVDGKVLHKIFSPTETHLIQKRTKPDFRQDIQDKIG